MSKSTYDSPKSFPTAETLSKGMCIVENVHLHAQIWGKKYNINIWQIYCVKTYFYNAF